MGDKITVTIKEREKVYKKGSTLLEISRDFQEEYAGDIILAFINGKLRELNKEVMTDCDVEFVTTKESPGHKTYVRGITLLLLKALYCEISKEEMGNLIVEHAIGNGYYCELDGEITLTEGLLQRIEDRMRVLVEEDITIRKYSISTEDAVAMFGHYKMYEKQKVFQYRRTSNTNIYDLDGFKDYFYGYMPASTGILKHFNLRLYEEGFLVQLPDNGNLDALDESVIRPKLFRTLQESKRWSKTMGVSTVGSLNDIIASDGIQKLILVQEALQEQKISDIAREIAKNKEKKFIMIAGPTSSGKTTFSHRLSIQLAALGLKPHPIAIDDYFVDREFTPLDEKGNYNFECLGAIDVDQFNKDMTALLQGKEIELPSFNFKTGKREYKGNYKKLGKDDILVVEGIHGLNDELSHTLPKESKFKIYISALTQINIDEHNRIPTTDGRLIRRIVRDARNRGTKAQDTIAMWSSVRRGEEEYIFPFQEEADVMFNSAMIYELSVLKQYVEPYLFGIPKDCPEYIEAKRLLKFLDYFIGVGTEDIPKNSIMREFIGGSIFKV